MGWMVERLFDVEAPVDMIVNAFARHVLSIAAALFLLSLIFRFPSTSSVRRAAQIERTRYEHVE
jgi:hypothetical protein